MWSIVNVWASQSKHTSCGWSGRAEEEDELQIWGDFFPSPYWSLTAGRIKKQIQTTNNISSHITLKKSSWTSLSTLRATKHKQRKKPECDSESGLHNTSFKIWDHSHKPREEHQTKCCCLLLHLRLEFSAEEATAKKEGAGVIQGSPLITIILIIITPHDQGLISWSRHCKASATWELSLLGLLAA